MSFLYPNVVTITRQIIPTGGGVQPYGGIQAAKEQVIFCGIPANIQQKSTGGRPDPHLPADAANKSFWRCLIPLSAGITNGMVLRGDIATDENGQRYFVSAPYINSLGPNFLVERLEA
jgi:hypothetical protein